MCLQKLSGTVQKLKRIYTFNFARKKILPLKYISERQSITYIFWHCLKSHDFLIVCISSVERNLLYFFSLIFFFAQVIINNTCGCLVTHHIHSGSFETKLSSCKSAFHLFSNWMLNNLLHLEYGVKTSPKKFGYMYTILVLEITYLNS